jgi:NAD(P)H-hydrate epimerase
MPIERITTLPPLPPRPAEGHKGLFGRVLIAVSRAILHAALSTTPELIGLGLGKGVGKDLLDAVDAADALIVGPGLGKSPDARARLKRLIRIDKPMVIDADGLNILAMEKRWPREFKAHAVLTPHPGEMKRLAKLFGRTDVPSDDDGRIDIAVKAATTFKQVIVLKGHRTVVTDAKRVYVNRTGDSTLSKAGTGDVLSGVIGSLVGQGMDLFDAACAGVYLHGKAGEIAGKKMGQRCALARELIDALPEAIPDYVRSYGS